MDLYSDHICDLTILKDQKYATVIKGILSHFCQKNLNSILVDQSFNEILDTFNGHEIPQFTLE